MLTLSAKIREISGRKTRNLRKQGLLPAILYGPKIENKPLLLDLKEFEKVYEEAGESSMIKLKIKGALIAKQLQGAKRVVPKVKVEEILVLIKEVPRDPLTDKFLHVDLYQPKLEEKVEVTIPLIFEGEAPAAKELEGVLVKNISEIEVKALPQNLPKEIKVDVSLLKTFEDNIQIKNLKLPPGVEVLKDPKEVVALVTPLEKEKLEKPVEEEAVVEEKVEEDEKEAKKVREKSN